jgi:hypothetical protein
VHADEKLTAFVELESAIPSGSFSFWIGHVSRDFSKAAKLEGWYCGHP